MNWIPLTDSSQLTEINLRSDSPSVRAVLVFKHSTRCSISSMALSRLESRWIDDAGIPAYFLDLLSFRPLSNEIASMYAIEHQSPQVLLIRNGRCIYTASHSDIRAQDILNALT